MKRKNHVSNVVFGCLVSLLTVILFASSVSAGIELSFASWVWGEPGFNEYFKDLSNEFERQTGIKIKAVSLSHEEYDSILMSQFAAGAGPDIVMYESPIYFKQVGGCIALDDYIAKSSIDFKKNWPPGQWDPLFGLVDAEDGKVYAIFNNWMPSCLIYNEKILNDSGIAGPPVYPEEFFDTAVKTTKGGQYGFAFHNKGGFGNYFAFRHFQLPYNGSFYDMDNPPYPTINTPENMEALHMIKRIMDAKAAPVGVDFSFYRRLFWEGKAAMMLEGIWNYGFFLNENPSIIKVAKTARQPFYSRRNWGGGHAISISGLSKHKDEAWKYIEFVSSDKWQAKVFDYSMILPANGKLPSDVIAKNSWIKNFLDNAPYGERGVIWKGAMPIMPQLQTALEPLIDLVIYQNMSPREACEKIQKEVENILREHGYIQ